MDRPTASPARRAHERGFTLIELMTVMAIMAVLIGIAIPNYRISIIMAREAVLLENLTTLRHLLAQYESDKGEYPPSLQTLVDEGYLKRLPIDPMTKQSDWQEVFGDPDPNSPGKAPGVEDVRSSAGGDSFGPPGTPYSEW